MILANWWTRAAGAVGIMASLTVLVALSLVTLAGHAWGHTHARRVRGAATGAGFTRGLFLALGGHLFLFFLVMTPAWSLPPWPWMGALGVVTLAVSGAALLTRTASLHRAGRIAGGTRARGVDAERRSLVAGGRDRRGPRRERLCGRLIAVDASLGRSPERPAGVADDTAATGAAAVLFAGEATAVLAVASGAVPLPLVVGTHVVSLATLLALTWHWRWLSIAQLAVLPAAAALVVQAGPVVQLETRWAPLLILAFALYAVFIVYPFVLARRAGGRAILTSRPCS